MWSTQFGCDRQTDRDPERQTDGVQFCDVGQCKALALVCCARRLDARLAFYRARASCLVANKGIPDLKRGAGQLSI